MDPPRTKIFCSDCRAQILRFDIARKSEARWNGVHGGRRIRAGFLLQEEEERAKGHSLLDSDSTVESYEMENPKN
jgi:hypothetical protein